MIDKRLGNKVLISGALISVLCCFAASSNLMAQAVDMKSTANSETLCGPKSCKSMGYSFVTSTPIADAKWVKIESTPERGDLFYDSNLDTAKDVEIKIAKSAFDLSQTTPKKTTIGMTRFLVNLPPSVMAPPHLVLIDEWEMTKEGPKKRDKPLIAKSILFNYEFDCSSDVYRITDSSAFTEANGQGFHVAAAASAPIFDSFEPINDAEGKPRGNREFSKSISDEKNNQNSLTYLVFNPASTLALFCKTNSTLAVLPTMPATAGTPPAIDPTTTAPKTNVTIVTTPEFAYFQERPSQIWAEHDDKDNTVYFKETNRTENTITLSGNGVKAIINLDSMRVIIERGNSKKSLNIDEASSDIHGWSVTEVRIKDATFLFASQEGPIKNWLERKPDGTERRLVEDSFDEWSVYLKSADGKSTVQIDLFKKLVIMSNNGNRGKTNFPILESSVLK